MVTGRFAVFIGMLGRVVGTLPSAVVGAKPLPLLVTTSSVSPVGCVVGDSSSTPGLAFMSIVPPPAFSDASFWILLRPVLYFSHIGLGDTSPMTPNCVAISWLLLCLNASASRFGVPEMICG